MRGRVLLPEIPKVELDVKESRIVDDDGRAFLRVRRVSLVARHADGTTSAPFPYDVIERRALDAAVMVAHHVEQGRVHVYLRSAARPPVALRPHPPALSADLWEVPAGLIEPEERPSAAAARELEEELGFLVAEDALVPLGPPSLPAPGFVGELHFHFHVRVDPSRRRDPRGDGSALEHGAAIVSVPLEEALEACRRGEILDAKTELALRRLSEALGAP